LKPRYFFCYLLILLSICSANAQDDDYLIDLGESRQQVLSEIIEKIERQTPYFFAYNSGSIALGTIIDLEAPQMKLERLVGSMARVTGLSFEIDRSNSKVIVSRGKGLSYSGYLIDSISGESIVGALLIADNRFLGASNASGYFSIMLGNPEETISVHNIGYRTKNLRFGPRSDTVFFIQMQPRLDLNIVITPESDAIHAHGTKLELNKLSNHYGTAGTHDLIQQLKSMPGVANGAEGQNGFTARGGGPNQNLILIDGMPVYEVSHLGGLSSVFLPSSIKSVDFYPSGFPSRFGGKLSSVLDVVLEGASYHLDGPLTDNTSVNLNLRGSWFTYFASPIFEKYTDVDDLRLQYYDSYLKLSHWFSATNKVSLSGYLGDDQVRISRDNRIDNSVGFRDFNEIKWGNRFLSLNWDMLLDNDWYMRVQLGQSTYDYRSRGSYDYNFIESDTLANRAFDIFSVSNLKDYIVSAEAEHYAREGTKFLFGMQYIHHTNSPSITESEKFVPGLDMLSEPLIDTSYTAHELGFYAEGDWVLSSNWRLNAGLRTSIYLTDNVSFIYPEPRVSIDYAWEKTTLGVSYSRMTQFVHLLTNPGPGLPSDLWVPSTARVEPEKSNNLSIDLSHEHKGLSWGGALWYKSFNNIIVYSNPSDLIYSIIINNELYQVEVDNASWEDRVSFGTGRAAGFELRLEKQTPRYQLALQYAYSRSFRQFDNIDGGDPFPYKYDSPHNISSQLNIKLGSTARILVNWSFASGTAYSLSDTERLGADGQPILVPSSRNNFRLPSFHHLDIHYSIHKKLRSGLLKWDVGLYNVYNRRNAFYEYLREDPESRVAELVKISIFPILPQFNLSYSW